MYEFAFTSYLPEAAKKIREEVFVKEQGFVDEFDATDRLADHLVVYESDKPIACCRYFPGKEVGEYVIGRIAVIKEYRGKHLGEKIMQKVEESVKKRSAGKLSLSAQVRVQGFYEKQGFVRVGETYVDEFCEHIRMEKII